MTRRHIPLAGVIGHPIAHSLSPRLHGYWLQHFGIAGHYVPIDVSHENFETVLRTLPKMGFAGVNVTVPHKETALRLADSVSDRAALIGAANTLTFRKSGRIHADNTDGEGFLRNLQDGAPGWAANAGTALILGAGGAARAVVSTLVKAGTPKIRIANRTRTRANLLAEEFGARVEAIDWNTTAEAMAGATVVINSTSLGMAGKPDMKLDLSQLKPTTLVTDLVYNPLETDLLKAAKARGCTTVDGLGMLLHQAVPAFEAWFNRKPDVTPGLRAHMLEALA